MVFVMMLYLEIRECYIAGFHSTCFCLKPDFVIKTRSRLLKIDGCFSCYCPLF